MDSSSTMDGGTGKSGPPKLRLPHVVTWRDELAAKFANGETVTRDSLKAAADAAYGSTKASGASAARATPTMRWRPD